MTYDLQTDQEDRHVMTVGDWFVTVLLLSIPFVNIIMLIVWAFSSDTNPNRRNYSRAIMLWLLLVAIFVVLAFIIGSLQQ